MFDEFQKRAIRSELSKVLASAQFARAENAAKFLTFVVDQTLDSRSESLNERVIAASVFGKPEDWDPKLDTTVRTEARRLRKKLGEYYASPIGEGQSVRIEIPVGSYVPILEVQQPSASTFLAQEQPLEKEVRTEARPPLLPTSQSVRGKRWPLAAAFTVMVLLSVVAALRWGRSSQEEPPFRTVPLTSEFGKQFSPTISPDSNRIAYVGNDGTDNEHIYIRSVDGGPPSRLTNGDWRELNPAFSPDGKTIAFLRVSRDVTDVVTRSVADGTEDIVGHIATQIGDWSGAPGPLIGNPGPVWTPDSKNLIVADHPPHSMIAGLFSIRLSDGARTQLTKTEGSVQDVLPRVSSDGQTLAFVRMLSHGVGDIYVLDLRTKQVRRITAEGRSVNGFAWTKAGNAVVSSDRGGTYQLWTLDMATGRFNKLNADTSNAMDPQIARNQDWLALVTTHENWTVSKIPLKQKADDEPAERYIASSGRNHSAHYSPDGKYVAFVSDRSGAWEIWLCRSSCTEPQKLTEFGGPWIGGLSWSPDSTRLAFDARVGRKSAIYVMSVLHPSPKALQQNDFEERMPTWSSDGKSLYFNSDRDGSVAIWRRDWATGKIDKIGPGFMAREFGEDGELAVGMPDGHIYVWSPAKPIESPLPPEVTAQPVLAWTTHAEAIYYSTLGAEGGLAVYKYHNGSSRKVAELNAQMPWTSASLDISPDGSALLLTTVETSSSSIYRRVGKLPK